MTDQGKILRLVIDVLGGCDATAADIGINERTVRRWYSGARAPGRDAQRMLFQALNRQRHVIDGLMLVFP